ncbi:MAG: SDR family oxidoreductase [Pseudomonadota bacterium]
MKLLILGGNGFIGFEVARAAIERGHDVTCIGRNIQTASLRLPKANWKSVDIATLHNAEKWAPLLSGVDAVINCAGALQSGLRDNLMAVQFTAMNAMYAAANALPSFHIVQVSANTSTRSEKEQTEFLSTKAKADSALEQSGVDYTILKPALVVGRNSYGGTALLRAVASLPFETSTTFGGQPCQTTDLDEFASICVDAAEGELGKGAEIAVASNQIYTINDVISQFRGWFGLNKAPKIPLPGFLMSITSLGADLAGYFGWKSPMRSTAMRVLNNGIVVEPGVELLETSSLEDTLIKHPSGSQDLWTGRSYFLKPAIVLVLSAFWLITGIIAWFNLDAATAYFEPIGFNPTLNKMFVVATSLLDCVLGLAILFRRFVRPAALGMIGLSLCYFVSATIVSPALWLDPIGPLVKVIPTMLLPICLLAILEER